jgi:hypothetical protein
MILFWRLGMGKRSARSQSLASWVGIWGCWYIIPTEFSNSSSSMCWFYSQYTISQKLWHQHHQGPLPNSSFPSLVRQTSSKLLQRKPSGGKASLCVCGTSECAVLSRRWSWQPIEVSWSITSTLWRKHGEDLVTRLMAQEICYSFRL